MLVKLEGNVGLALAAPQYLLVEAVLRGGVGGLPTDQFGSALQRRARLGFTFAVVFPI